VLFESQPGFHVTANLYKPTAKPGAAETRLPAVLHPVGHSENGKAYAEYQRANRLLVEQGFIVLCYDPIGQGERKQLFSVNGGPAKEARPTHQASGEHQALGTPPILLGRGLGTYMLWDAIRALDYLCERPDVDSQRIGCTGISGGGNLTSYLMAYDERIAAAAPGCFMTTHRRKNESPGPGDAEQNLFDQIRAGFDHPDFILARAPKPTLILTASNDFVPIEGSWEAFREAKRVYTRLGHPERVDLVEANAKHGFSRRLREATARFMTRWLQGQEIEVFEEDQPVGPPSQATLVRPGGPVLTDEQLRVTPNGQVMWLANERSLLELYAEEEQRLAKQRPGHRALQGSPAMEARSVTMPELIRQVTGIRALPDLPRSRVERIDAKPDRNSPGEGPARLVLHPEPGISLPALYWANGDKQPIVIAPAKGMNAAVEQAQRLHASGHPVLIVEVRDTGETATRNWRFPGADFYIALMLGKSYLAMRAEDILVASQWLASQHSAGSVQLISDGEIGPAAWHAAALEPQLVTSIETSGDLQSWQQLMSSPESSRHLHNAVHGALRHYDLPDLRALVDQR
ncbi:MAG: prolyl oligopeptidase family serine peptidase, partial [Planctomycetales bacterium]|nr:prolyl oligopeptidase family serine peptidase [Planctomycetales bacterium]